MVGVVADVDAVPYAVPFEDRACAPRDHARFVRMPLGIAAQDATAFDHEGAVRHAVRATLETAEDQRRRDRCEWREDRAPSVVLDIDGPRGDRRRIITVAQQMTFGEHRKVYAHVRSRQVVDDPRDNGGSVVLDPQTLERRYPHGRDTARSVRTTRPAAPLARGTGRSVTPPARGSGRALRTRSGTAS